MSSATEVVGTATQLAQDIFRFWHDNESSMKQPQAINRAKQFLFLHYCCPCSTTILLIFGRFIRIGSDFDTSNPVLPEVDAYMFSYKGCLPVSAPGLAALGPVH